MRYMSKKDKEKDEDGLDADERAIIDSIDFDKIAADVAAKKDEIVASAVASAKKKTRESAGKTRNYGIAFLIIALIVLVGGILSLDAGIGLYLLISGALILVFSIFLLGIARSNKKL